MPRLAFAAPGIAVALAATVAIVVLANRGQSEPAQDVSALSRLNATTEASTPSATLAPKATAGDGASSKYAVARVQVPALVGHSVREARALARTRGLRVLPEAQACALQSAPRVRARPRSRERRSRADPPSASLSAVASGVTGNVRRVGRCHPERCGVLACDQGHLARTQGRCNANDEPCPDRGHSQIA